MPTIKINKKSQKQKRKRREKRKKTHRKKRGSILGGTEKSDTVYYGNRHPDNVSADREAVLAKKILVEDIRTIERDTIAKMRELEDRPDFNNDTFHDVQCLLRIALKYKNSLKDILFELNDQHKKNFEENKKAYLESMQNANNTEKKELTLAYKAHIKLTDGDLDFMTHYVKEIHDTLNYGQGFEYGSAPTPPMRES
jgi:ABC-type Zn uptake system ZnuABC Zn-binding protein ZnuA